MKTSQMFPSKYMSKEDLPTSRVLTIGGIKMETLEWEGETSQKAVIVWTDPKVKPIILNRVNVSVLADSLGDDTDDWVGEQVSVYVDPHVMFMGRMVGGIRLRVTDPPAEEKKNQVTPTASRSEKKGGGK
jgi:hypothetical protein